MGLTTTFVGVDADAVGNGDDDETLPIDTWLQRRIQYNNQDMLTPAAGVCWAPISGSASDFTEYHGIRPYCSFDWHSLWHGAVWVLPDQTHIELTLAYHAEALGSSTDAGDIQLALTASDGSTTFADPATLGNTYSSGTTVGHQTVVLELKERIRDSKLLKLAIWIRSDSTVSVSTTIGSGGGITANLYHEEPYRLRDSALTAAPGFFDPNASGTPPAAESLEGMYVLGGAHPTWSAGAGRKYDLQYAADNSTRGTFAGVIQPVVRAAAAVASSGTAFRHQCLMLRAVFVRPIFGSVAVSYASSAIMPITRLAPNIEFGSAEAQRQAQDIIRAYSQPTVALVGPRGRVGDLSFAEADLDRFAANGYAVHWPTILGEFDNTAPDAGAGNTGEHRDLINEGIYLRTENPRLEIRCLWLSVQHGAGFNQHQVQNGKPGQTQKGRGNEGKLDVTLEDGPGEATWSLTAELEQLGDASSGVGSWASDVTSYASLTQTMRIPVYGANVRGGLDVPPVLRGTDSMDAAGKADTSDPGFWFREGSLYAGMGDYDVLHETSVFLDVADTAQAQTLLPFRLRLEMELSTFNKPVKLGLTEAQLLNDLRLTLVSVTVIEHPQLP